MAVVNTKDLNALSRVRSLSTSGAARSIRLGAQLTLNAISQEVGVSIATVCRWELGQRVPRGDAALAYARVLDDLMSGSTE